MPPRSRDDDGFEDRAATRAVLAIFGRHPAAGMMSESGECGNDEPGKVTGWIFNAGGFTVR